MLNNDFYIFGDTTISLSIAVFCYRIDILIKNNYSTDKR